MSGEKHVVALLMVPLPGEPSGLVKTWKPQGNGRPPLAWKGPMGWNTGPPYLQHSALPLWWNDELVGLGWDITRRFLLENTELSQRRSDHEVERILQQMWPSFQECRIIAEQMANLGFVERLLELYHDSYEGLQELTR